MSDSNQPARDQGVGVYIDGVYMGRPQGLGVALYEVESLEVLKGPQGTLFGRNTEGGAVNITTRRPSGTFRLVASAGVGNFGSYKSELHFDMPTYMNFSFKLDAVISSRDGFVRNPLVSARDFGETRKAGMAAAILWEPNDNFSAIYGYDNGKDESTTLHQYLLAKGTAALPALARIQPHRVSQAAFGVPQIPSIGTSSGHRLGLDWQVNEHLKIRSISSYREMTQGQYDNGSGDTGVTLANTSFTGQNFSRMSLAQFKQDQTSQEIQLIGDMQRLKFVAGATFFEENVEDDAQAFFTNQFTNADGSAYTVLPINDFTKQIIDRASRVKSTSTGVFAQGTYTPPILGDKLHVTLGGRWSQDKKVGELFIINNQLPSVNGVVGPVKLNASWDRFDPLINFAYDISPDFMVYVKHSSGYRSGGANSRSLTYAPFNPEVVEMQEIGAKIEFLNRRARLNLAAYTGKYIGMQVDFSARYRQVDPVTGLTLLTTRTTQEATNAPGEGDVSGFEADFTFAVTDNLTFSASYAHNIVTIPNVLNPFPQADGKILTIATPIRQTHTPENSGSFALDYRTPFTTATLIAHLDANFDDGYYSSRTDVAYDPITGAVTIPAPKGEKSFVVNGRLALTDVNVGDGIATFSLWARNLLNEEHINTRNLDVKAGTTGFFNEPRTFGIEVKIRM